MAEKEVFIPKEEEQQFAFLDCFRYVSGNKNNHGGFFDNFSSGSGSFGGGSSFGGFGGFGGGSFGGGGAGGSW